MSARWRWRVGWSYVARERTARIRAVSARPPTKHHLACFSPSMINPLFCWCPHAHLQRLAALLGARAASRRGAPGACAPGAAARGGGRAWCCSKSSRTTASRLVPSRSPSMSCRAASELLRRPMPTSARSRPAGKKSPPSRKPGTRISPTTGRPAPHGRPARAAVLRAGAAAGASRPPQPGRPPGAACQVRRPPRTSPQERRLITLASICRRHMSPTSFPGGALPVRRRAPGAGGHAHPAC